MRLDSGIHLTYCTNIHPSNSWIDAFNSLKEYIPQVHQAVAPRQPFGIGLRLSALAAQQLLAHHHMCAFQQWLEQENAYVFTINGFPYGSFHGSPVKDEVHQPDWTTCKRVEYTTNLAKILSLLLPQGMTGGISTSPLSYKRWFATPAKLQEVTQQAADNIAHVALFLYEIHQETGKFIHLDIEPEPDGILEDLRSTVETFQQFIFPAIEKLATSKHLVPEKLFNHVQLCYDVCHFAVGYQMHAQALAQLRAAGIGIGKFQLSAALRVIFDSSIRSQQLGTLATFDEPIYLHQVVARMPNGTLLPFADLPQALHSLKAQQATEWRIHFHVPIFLHQYGFLQSTQPDVLEVLALQQKHSYTQHLEVETYTWSVLPPSMQLPLSDFIAKELLWVIENIPKPSL
ncbi:MAG: metabolite traffic protein EboE [Cytophagales bacterium]|nr:metabolite traffic protein EboE [Bernardetiaceae bacterium]MDW8210957.1 metabolite traffic protein EboE [Cytophagales bacterium]